MATFAMVKKATVVENASRGENGGEKNSTMVGKKKVKVRESEGFGILIKRVFWGFKKIKVYM